MLEQDEAVGAHYLPAAAYPQGADEVRALADRTATAGTETGVGAAVGGLTVLLTAAYSVREMGNAKKAEESEDAE